MRRDAALEASAEGMHCGALVGPGRDSCKGRSERIWGQLWGQLWAQLCGPYALNTA